MDPREQVLVAMYTTGSACVEGLSDLQVADALYDLYAAGAVQPVASRMIGADRQWDFGLSDLGEDAAERLSSGEPAGLDFVPCVPTDGLPLLARVHRLEALVGLLLALWSPDSERGGLFPRGGSLDNVRRVAQYAAAGTPGRGRAAVE